MSKQTTEADSIFNIKSFEKEVTEWKVVPSQENEIKTIFETNDNSRGSSREIERKISEHNFIEKTNGTKWTVWKKISHTCEVKKISVCLPSTKETNCQSMKLLYGLYGLNTEFKWRSHFLEIFMMMPKIFFNFELHYVSSVVIILDTKFKQFFNPFFYCK